MTRIDETIAKMFAEVRGRSEEGDILDALLVGRKIRVYTEGGMLTSDFDLNRINIEMDKETRLAKKVWVG